MGSWGVGEHRVHHEIGHILLGSGHPAWSPSDNLMIRGGHGDALTDFQKANAYAKAQELEKLQGSS